GVNIEESQNVTWHGFPYAEWGAKQGMGIVSDPDDLFEIEGRLFRAAKAYEPYRPMDGEFVPYSNLQYTMEEVVVFEENDEVIRSYVEESIARFILSNQDVMSDAAWNSYLDDLESLNLREYLAVVQSAYDRYMKGR
ncbi:MAG: hypothetical protein MI892_31600, partial [Desulfobacterales bacterium]|nr:hypothetical protein [Desulfobacterales bacterium]